MNLLKDSGEKFEFESKEDNHYYGNTESIYVNIRSIKQLETLKRYGLSDIEYSGWFGCELSENDMESGNIIWAGNKNKKSGTRFGIKFDGDTMFRIAMNRGTTFVYLDSNSTNTLEHFLEQEENKVEQEYETDYEFRDNSIDYDR